MPTSKAPSNGTSQDNHTGVVSHAKERAAARQQQNDQHNMFLTYLVNGLVQVDSGFADHEHALDARFHTRFIALLDDVQRWLRRSLEAEGSNNGNFDNNEPVTFHDYGGGDDWTDLDRLWEGFLLGLAAVDGEFARWEMELREAFGVAVRDLLSDTQAWLRQQQRGKR